MQKPKKPKTAAPTARAPAASGAAGTAMMHSDAASMAPAAPLGCASLHWVPISDQFAGMMVKNFAAMGFWKSYSSRYPRMRLFR